MVWKTNMITALMYQIYIQPPLKIISWLTSRRTGLTQQHQNGGKLIRYVDSEKVMQQKYDLKSSRIDLFIYFQPVHLVRSFWHIAMVAICFSFLLEKRLVNALEKQSNPTTLKTLNPWMHDANWTYIRLSKASMMFSERFIHVQFKSLKFKHWNYPVFGKK